MRRKCAFSQIDFIDFVNVNLIIIMMRFIIVVIIIFIVVGTAIAAVLIIDFGFGTGVAVFFNGIFDLMWIEIYLKLKIRNGIVY